MIDENENLSVREKEKTFSEQPVGKKESWLDVVKFVLIVAAIVFPIRMFIAQPFLVSGPSMIPTFQDKNYLIVDEISKRFTHPQRGEIVIFRRAGESKYLIKRIIGLPGDTLTLEGEKITVTNAENPKGFVFEQPFVVNNRSESKTTVILDGADYYVLGDNRPVSYDSRYFGPIPESAIIGRPVVRLYPFGNIEMFPGDDTK
ncbi:MAG: signal peptidase I [Candidatus Taylorbacteria bacterium]|nr:signal peptidase I [Candidatus Taylorbacteria bacterium]